MRQMFQLLQSAGLAPEWPHATRGRPGGAVILHLFQDPECYILRSLVNHYMGLVLEFGILEEA